MKLYEQQDDSGMKRKSKTRKLMRQKKHRVERKAAKLDPECQPLYKAYSGWVL